MFETTKSPRWTSARISPVASPSRNVRNSITLSHSTSFYGIVSFLQGHISVYYFAWHILSLFVTVILLLTTWTVQFLKNGAPWILSTCTVFDFSINFLLSLVYMIYMNLTYVLFYILFRLKYTYIINVELNSYTIFLIKKSVSILAIIFSFYVAN